MAQKWIKVAMKGRSQVIPPICPNCLEPAELKFRYGYRGIEGWLTRTTYYQTFTYCQACHPQAVSAVGLRRWGIFAGVAAFFAWIPLMIVGIYATLGVFLIIASRHPLEHLSLIWFTVWSSLVHGGIMAIQSFELPENHGHLLGDVPALLIVAVVLAVLTPRGEHARVAAGRI